MILVTGDIFAKPETLEELKRIGLEHCRRSREEPGCLSHDMHVHAEDPLRLVFVERWADAASLKAHFRVPDSGAMVKQAAALSARPTTIQIYETSEKTMRDVFA